MDNIPPGMILLGLLAVFPIQFYLSPSQTSDIKYYLQRFTDRVFATAEDWGVTLPGATDRHPNKEIDEYIEAMGGESRYFGASMEIRVRSPDLRFRIGDVVRHVDKGYRAVIVGWDLTARAPDTWIAKIHAGNPHWTTQPNYAILIDERDRSYLMLAYVPQERIELLDPPTPVNHFLVKNYFERYDYSKKKYIPKPIFRRSYPDD